MIKDNIIIIKNEIIEALKKSGRNENEASLIAVSKTKPVNMIKEAYDCGMRDFGENKVQELVDKYDRLPNDIRWHLIGHLQTNKVKYIIDKAYLIHSVDSYKLAKEISKEALKKNVTANILIEVNVASEESKYGVSVEECESLIILISKLPGICIKGLMTVAPFVENEEDNRLVFRKLKQLFIDIKEKNIDNVFMEIMSMGMSGDYRVAVEEGEVVADAVEVLLGVELALAVRRVGARHVVLADVLVGLLLVYGAEDAERTEEHEALQRHLQLDERIDEVLCALGIHAAEVGLVETFGHAGGMNDVVELVLAELRLQLLLRTEVKLNKMYAFVLKIFARCGFSHCCPHLHISVEGFLNDKTANEATGSCYKYLVSHS